MAMSSQPPSARALATALSSLPGPAAPCVVNHCTRFWWRLFAVAGHQRGHFVGISCPESVAKVPDGLGAHALAHHAHHTLRVRNVNAIRPQPLQNADVNQ